MTGFGLTPGFTATAGATGTVTGPRNRIEYWCSPKADPSASFVTNKWDNSWTRFYDGVYTWTKPSNINTDIPLRVWVWGPGGNGGCSGGSGNGYGGGGGGMAYKEIAISSLGSTETVTVGVPSYASYNSRGTTSSFGSHCSASGGNDGEYSSNPPGNPNSTGENSNPLNNQNAQGGVGIGGDINRRGGWGGEGSQNPGSGFGGGGASAPAPDGQRDGFMGGRGVSYTAGSGASIKFNGSRPHTTWSPPGGAGTAGNGSGPYDGTGERTRGGPGGAGLFGAGGRGATKNWYSSNDSARPSEAYAADGKGGAIWDPNMLMLGGGGGGGSCAGRFSSACWPSNAGCGGPGAGGGAVGTYDSSNDTRGAIAGNGGVLGGGGGAAQYQQGSNGGCGGGAGSSGYDGNPGHHHYGWEMGGNGLIVITYAIA